jgi:hypothetical protein
MLPLGVSTMFDREVLLNQIAQDIIPFEKGLAWFKTLSSDEKREVIRSLCRMSIQEAHYLDSEIDLAIAISGLKPTHTPCVLLKKGKEYLRKTIELPEKEQIQSFCLLIALYSIADKRRREKCGENCHHWWHTDTKNYPPLL